MNVEANRQSEEWRHHTIKSMHRLPPQSHVHFKLPPNLKGFQLRMMFVVAKDSRWKRDSVIQVLGSFETRRK